MKQRVGVGHSAESNVSRSLGSSNRQDPPSSARGQQREIVAEIEGYQKVIDGARAVVDNYRPHIVVDPEWPLVALGDVCSCERLQYGLSTPLNIHRTQDTRHFV